MVPDKFEDQSEKESEYQFNDGDEGNMIYDSQEESDAETSPVSDGDVPAAAENANPSQPAKSTSMTTKNKVMLVVMGVLALLIVYKLVSLLFFEKSPEHHLGASKVVSAVPPSDLTTVLKGTSVQQTPSVSAVPFSSEGTFQTGVISGKTSEGGHAIVSSSSPENTTQQISDLKKQNQQLLSELNNQKADAKAQLASMQQKLQDLQSTISGLQDVIKDLNTQLKKQAAVQQSVATQAIQLKRAQDKQIQAGSRYFVEAVIPGRAWLKSTDGSALTVTVGDEIPGYGIVTSINSYSGTVLTDSGQKIYYGING